MEDFGHLLHRAPREVVHPDSPGAAAEALLRAGPGGFAARGRGHSVWGRAQAPGGTVADTGALAAVGEVRDGAVDAGAGATWEAVLAATLPRGLAPPVLPDYLRLSVGGTLVVGGVGPTTWRDGVQSDHVLALEVVAGTGERVVCSAEREPALFDAVRAGLGQVAMIVRATLALRPAPAAVRRYTLTYPALAALLADERALAREGRFASVRAVVAPGPDGWEFRLDAAAAHAGPGDDARLLAGLSDDRDRAEAATAPFADDLARLARLEEALRAKGWWGNPHPWLTTFVGDAAIAEVAADELARLDPAGLGPFGQVAIGPVRPGAVRTPLVRMPDGDLAHTFNVIRFPATADPGEAAQSVAANRAAYERIREAGGTLYPVSAFPMSPDDWRRHLGPAHAPLAAARHRWDPRGVMTPGYEVFAAS